jgi:hypothetical protein
MPKAGEISSINALFCRTWEINKETGELNLFGVVPELHIDAIPKNDEKDELFGVKADLTLYLQARINNPLSEVDHFTLEIKAEVNEHFIGPRTLKIPIPPGFQEWGIPINLTSPQGLPLKFGKQELTVTIAQNQNILGKVKLPIKMLEVDNERTA